MSNYGCPKCLIVYTMISDSTETKVCKKCGKTVVYWDEDYVNSLEEHKPVKYDHMWSSILPYDEIDPDYEPKS